ncbi:hypothetical protein C8J57DRAFT_1531253 [Mycena rebaudengoi]|nr:hypothetical protein C8J57DRAFT_1531253 [Mycena rebaudengoi]
MPVSRALASLGRHIARDLPPPPAQRPLGDLSCVVARVNCLRRAECGITGFDGVLRCPQKHSWSESTSAPVAPRTEPMYSGEGHQLSFSNIAQQDQLVGSPEFTYEFIQHNSPPASSSLIHSRIPLTPGLSYSPSSTESSSGDRTIQMSGFLEDSSVPAAHATIHASPFRPRRQFTAEWIFLAQACPGGRRELSALTHGTLIR